MDRSHDTCEGGGLLSRLTAEEQLELLRAMIDKSMDAVVVHDVDGEIVFYNEGLCRLLGLTPEEMANLHPFGWIAPESIRGAPGRLESILHEGELRFHSKVRRHDGSTLPTQVAARRLDTVAGPLIVATIRDASEHIDSIEHLQYLAYHDSLTGLASRAAFEDGLLRAIAGAHRHGDVVILAYIDLDRFKPINDRFGHRVGDEVLIEVGRRIMGAVRTPDLVARLGGDEFVVLFNRATSAEDIPAVAHRLLDAIRAPMEPCGCECSVDASIGFSVFDPENDTARTLVVKADVAMYEAKRDPGHPWLVYDPSMGEVEGEHP